MFRTIMSTRTPDGSPFSSELLDELAREKQFIQRKSSRISASGFVCSLMNAVIGGRSSFSDLSDSVETHDGICLSRQALHQRVNHEALSFMESVAGIVLAQKCLPRGIMCNAFSRVLVQDSSQVQMHPANHVDFKSHGNKKGKTAGFKIDLCWDLLNAQSVSTSCVPAPSNDKKAGNLLVEELVKPGDLILRDMGYYNQETFRRIGNLDAFWLSKIPSHAGAIHQKKSIDKILATTRRDQLDLDVELGGKQLKARMVACRATPEQAAQKQRKARIQAKKHGKTQKKNARLRGGWHILITNIPAELMSTEEVIELYALGWQIETIFKAWKQGSGLQKCFDKKSNVNHLGCLILASLIWLVTILKVTTTLQKMNAGWVSVRKVARRLGNHLIRQCNLETIELFDPDPREIVMEKRQRMNLMQRASKCLA